LENHDLDHEGGCEVSIHGFEKRNPHDEGVGESGE